ncbi:MAG: CHAT domain-containing protein [Acidobacteriota bacterium]
MDNRAQADHRIKELLRGLGSDRAEQCWAGFLDGYAPLIQQVVRTFAKDEDGISEGFIFVCQRLCHNRFRRLRSFDPEGPARFETWLRVVVQRLCLDWRRHKTGRFRLFKSIARLSRLERELFRRLYREGLGLESAFESLRTLFPGLTRAEVESGAGRIARLFPGDSDILSGIQASESAFKSRAGHYRTIHLATHSDFDKGNPLKSSLVLEAGDSEDGRLEAHEIAKLRRQSFRW